MEIFSESPKSFKIDRKSTLASKLKSSISKKLFEFLGNYTDDVLAEYITVLVCNGKHQNQARDNLEVFLGERSGEFVSWLWDFLLKYGHQSDSTIGLSNTKDVPVTSPCISHANRELRSSRSQDHQNHNGGNTDSSLTKTRKFYQPSTDKQRSGILREVGATKNIHDNSLMHEPIGMGGSSVTPVGVELSTQCLDKSKKIVDSTCDEFPDHLLCLPKKETIFRNMQSSVAEGPCTRRIHAANVSASSSPREVGSVSSGNKKSRGSVWDRLGKPCENSFVSKKIDTHGVDVIEQDQKTFDEHTILRPDLNGELGERMKSEANKLDKRCSVNNSAEYQKMEHYAAISELHVANNNRRKRHFTENTTGPNYFSVSLVGESNMDSQYKRNSRNSKRSNLTSEKSESVKPVLVSQVQDVKKRLHQIEAEMSKLRSKQLGMKKDGEPNVLSNTGAMKLSEEDVESRTVFVTNVHFAATKEALSLYFAQCGVVLNVVMMTDGLIAQPKGSAYITFASKESVDKAMALSGTSFFSRTLKVMRKADEAAPTQLAAKPSRAQLPRINRKAVTGRPFYASYHLKWRREPVPAASEPSASTSDEDRVGACVSQQQPPSSVASVMTTQAAASLSTEEAPIAA
ncbi:uncharacterized protein LOC132308798 isoform X2 [Cornus florida]|uniref:uncharacterized protein LOC132308798 isoform X2 n=1 Tax=Cornus florida TaxID=4283 RepID=UPI00289F2366|nr:uncharacterized protein LOC132308798 isoform X2 [Cornus florida]